MCARGDHSKMRMGSNDAECTNACVESHGAAYVLFDGKVSYTLKGKQPLQKLAGQKVQVVGNAGRQDQHDPGRLGQRGEVIVWLAEGTELDGSTRRHGATEHARRMSRRSARPPRAAGRACCLLRVVSASSCLRVAFSMCSPQPCAIAISSPIRAPSGCRPSGAPGTPSRSSRSQAGGRATCRTRGPCPSSATTTAGSRRPS